MTDRWHQMTDLFSRALALTPAERQAYLSGACEADPSLRRELEGLLQADDACEDDRFLRLPIAAAVVAMRAPGPAGPAPSTPALSPETGSHPSAT